MGDLSTAVSVETADEQRRERHYWRNNFFAVLLPFVFIGLPVHIVLPSRKTADLPKVDLSWRYWLEFRIRSPFAGVLTLVLLPFYVYSNYDVFYAAITLFIDIVIKGRVRYTIFTRLLSFLYSLPFFVMVNYAWFYGHLLNSVVESFDTPTSVLTVDTVPRTDRVPNDCSNEQGPQGDTRDGGVQQGRMLVVRASARDMYFRKTLAGVYFAIFSSIIIHIFTISYRIDKEEWTIEEIWAHALTYFKRIMYTLILPVYMTFCGAISCQINALAGFMKDCIRRGDRMRRSHIYLIKKAYQRIADSIVRTNFLFGYYLPLVVIVLDIFTTVNSKDLLKFVFQRISSAFSPAGNDNETMEINEDIDFGSDTVGVPPDVVRYLLGIAVETGLSIFLMWMVAAEALFTNDKARHLHVWLNDFATESLAPYRGTTDQNHNSNSLMEAHEYPGEESIYKEFRLLKFYMHSRMEAQAERHRALLNIRGIGYITTFLSSRLVEYRLRN